MVEIIPKKAKKNLPWQKISFYIASAILVAVILGYVVLTYFETKSLAVLEDLKDRISKVGTPEERITEQKVFNYMRKINDFSELLAARHSAVNFFENFQKIIHPKIWFSDFDLNIATMEVRVSGQAINPQVLDQQLAILKKQETIQNADLSELKIGKEGELEFTFIISLKPEIFIK